MEARTPLARAKAIALRYLAARARTEAQVRSRLERADLGAQGDEVVAWLLRLGYVDDAAFARARARALVSQGRLGPSLAERRLESAGVPRDAAREAVREAVREAAGGLARESDGELALCRALALQRAPDLGALDGRALRRLSRFLLGRGFSGEAVARALGIPEDAG